MGKKGKLPLTVKCQLVNERVKKSPMDLKLLYGQFQINCDLTYFPICWQRVRARKRG